MSLTTAVRWRRLMREAPVQGVTARLDALRRSAAMASARAKPTCLRPIALGVHERGDLSGLHLSRAHRRIASPAHSSNWGSASARSSSPRYGTAGSAPVSAGPAAATRAGSRARTRACDDRPSGSQTGPRRDTRARALGQPRARRPDGRPLPATPKSVSTRIWRAHASDYG